MSELTYSPGLEGVVAGETAVSSIENGLSYRGYAVEELADLGTFEETAYLLLHGELPKREELAAFRHRIAEASTLPTEVIAALGSLPADSSMMDAMRTGCSMLSAWDPEVNDNSHAANLRKAERLLAKFPVVMAATYRLRKKLPLIAADPGRSIAGNVLYMVTGKPPAPHHERAMDASLVMYAEHEFNASTFTARVIASTLADLHCAITGAIGALKGPLHGGANERVLEVLQEVGSPDKAEAWIRQALANKVKIMGFGHRVYKTGDPRAKYLKPLCARLAKELGQEAMEQVADTIQSVVQQEKKLPPNLDWPSARLYHYLGLSVDLYTPLFVVARVTGWSAHVIEQHDNNRLMRPRGIYTGAADRKFVPVEKR